LVGVVKSAEDLDEDDLTRKFFTKREISSEQVLSLVAQFWSEEQEVLPIPTVLRNSPSKEPQYWIVPRDKIGLLELVKALGYFVEKGDILTFCCGSPELGTTLIARVEDGEISVHYAADSVDEKPDFALEQLRVAIEFREFLDINRIKYTEVPPRKEVFSKIIDLGRDADYTKTCRDLHAKFYESS